jgi:hypothetical protein
MNEVGIDTDTLTGGNEIDGSDTDGSETDGNDTDGNETDGNETDGNETDGNETDGSEIDGSETDGSESVGSGGIPEIDGNGTGLGSEKVGRRPKGVGFFEVTKLEVGAGVVVGRVMTTTVSEG